MAPERAASSFSGYPSRDMTARLGDLLEPPERAGGLGELSLALARRGPRRSSGFGIRPMSARMSSKGRDIMSGTRTFRSRRL
jgi:hypothetical protein